MAVKKNARRQRVVDLCVALPEVAVTEVNTHLKIEVRKKTFVYWLDNHHGDGRLAIHAKMDPELRKGVLDEHADRFFFPPYVGVKGWVGLWLDLPEVDWGEVEAVLEGSYRLVAPRTLVSRLEEARGGDPGSAATRSRRRPAARPAARRR